MTRQLAIRILSGEVMGTSEQELEAIEMGRRDGQKSSF